MAKKTVPGEGLTDQQQEALVQIGKMMGPHATGFDDRVQQMHDEAHADEHARTDYEKEFGSFPSEASARKMRAAQTGGASETALGPSEMDTTKIKQRGAMQEQAATQGAVQAQQAQGAQAPVNAPPAPTGPAGSVTPYPAQKGPQPPPSATQGLPPPGEAPSGGPQEEEQ